MAAKTGKAILAGVIGDPISHSLSPAIHEYWIKHYGKDAAYIPIHIKPETLETSIKHLYNMGFSGFNVTLPHKENLFKLCYETDEIAKKTKAVNTVNISPDGKYYGKNTDLYGFIKSAEAAKITLDNSTTATILGAGGAAKAIIVGLLEKKCPKIYILNRTESRAETLCDSLASFYPDTKLIPLAWEKAEEALENSNVLVNTTQLGMAGQDPLTIDIAPLSNKASVIDIIYTPFETELLKNAKSRDMKRMNGLGMLLYQAIPGHRDWYGTDPEVTPELHDYIKSLLR